MAPGSAGGARVDRAPRLGVGGAGLVTAGATSIVSLDLAEPTGALASATLIGYAQSVYANDDVLLVQQVDYGDDTELIPQLETNIHRFELDGLATTYSASGSVAGYVAAPFGIDEAGGIVRAVTTQGRYAVESLDGEPSLIYLGTANHVVTLGADGGALVELGRSPDFGGGETYLYQARFLGDHAHAFTYGTVDGVAGGLEFLSAVRYPPATPKHPSGSRAGARHLAMRPPITRPPSRVTRLGTARPSRRYSRSGRR